MAGTNDTLAFDPTTAKLDETSGPPASGFDPSTAKMSSAGPLADDARAAPGQTAVHASLYPGVDFNDSLPFLDRANLAQADNFSEKQRYLEKRYGKSNVRVEKHGLDGKPMLIVKRDGKQIPVLGQGFLASMLGDSPEMLGMAGGAMTGAAYGSGVGPLGSVAGGIIGAGVGGMLGKGATEASKGVQGTFDKDLPQLGHELGKSGLEGMAGEMVGRGGAQMLSRITRGPVPSWLTDTTPESRGMTERTLSGGAMPPSSSTMPGARKIQRIETLATKISGEPKKQVAANKKYLENRVGEILERSGIPKEHTQAVLKDLDNPSSAATTQQVGHDLQESVRAHIETLEHSADDAVKELDTQIDKSLSHLNSLATRYKPGDLGLDVAEGISSARRDFAVASTKVFKQVDRLAGGHPIVPTKLMKREAQRLVALMPESDASRPIVKEIADYPEMVTFEQAQRARTQLHDLQHSTNLTPGATKHEYGKLADAVDRSFDQAKRLVAEDFRPSQPNMNEEDAALLGEFGLGRQELPRNAEDLSQRARAAGRMLDAADTAYSRGIKKFQDTTINRLVASARAGLPPDPSVIAKTIITPGQSARVAEIKKIVGEDTFRRVAAQDWQNLVTGISAQDGSISGKKLFAEITRRGDKLMETVYGAKDAKAIRELAQNLSARDGHIPPDFLQPGNAHDVMQSVKASQEQFDEFMKKDYLSAIADPQRTPEDAYRWMTQPGQTDRLQAAEKFFGKGSAQMQAVRQQATKTVLDSVVTRAANGEGSKALTNALRDYTQEQQKILFPNGLDEDMKLLGREIEFLFPNKADQAMAGFSAGNILEMPWYKRYYHQAVGSAWRTFVQHPTVVRALAIGLRGDGKTRRITRQAMKEMAYFGSLELGDDEDQLPDDSAAAGAGGVGAGQTPGQAPIAAPANH